MKFLQRLASTVIQRDTALKSQTWDVTRPPPHGFAPASTDSALTLVDVYRATQIITTAVIQLPINVYRNNHVIPSPSLIEVPCLEMTRPDFIAQTILSMVLHGNAFWRLTLDEDDAVVNLSPLNPATVHIDKDERGKLSYSVNGKRIQSKQIVHLAVMKLPGRVYGMGPIQAARENLTGAIDTRDYSAAWFKRSGQPSGILTSDKVIGREEAIAVRNAFNGRNADGTEQTYQENPSRVRVLGAGFKYEPIMLSPKDAQWLEVQEFNSLQIARLFGVPSSLMLLSPQGGSMVYSNIEQDWIGFLRFTVMQYLKPIETALTSLTVRGQQVRFNLEGLLRSDTNTRYSAFATALQNGFLTINEVREIEGRNPLPDELKEEEDEA